VETRLAKVDPHNLNR